MAETEGDVAIFDDLKRKRALVTGASSGLGLHMAGLLAQYGASVTLAARRTDLLADEAKRLTAAGHAAAALALDVTDSAAVAACFAQGPGWDIVVNNAGISREARILDMSPADWRAVLDTNLSGAFLVAQAAARQMVEAGRPGAILNIASITGLRVAGSLAAYAASKAALVSLTQSMALEWARHGIRVNALCPGYIETDLNRDFFSSAAGETMLRRIPQRRLGTPQDLDGAVLLLCSDAGSFITGAALAVDGGHLVSSL
jgi:NAD(P)-dependent dehydrogenase (short-subunit alcohol dehydrogenase family)